MAAPAEQTRAVAHRAAHGEEGPQPAPLDRPQCRRVAVDEPVPATFAAERLQVADDGPDVAPPRDLDAGTEGGRESCGKGLLA